MILIKSKIEILLSGLLLTLAFFNNTYSQKTLHDSLETIVNNNRNQDTLKVIQLNNLANINFSYDVKNLSKYSQQALFLARKLKYKHGEAIAYQNMALSYMLINGDVTALKYLHSSLKLFSELKDTINMARNVNYIGCYYATIKDFKAALPHFLKSEKLVANRKDPLCLTIISNTGSCYEDLKQFDMAKSYFDRVKVLANDLKDNHWIVVSLYQTASLYLMQKNYKRALVTCNEALSITGHIINPRDMKDMYLLKGDIYYQSGQYSQSRKYYERGAGLVKQMNSRENMAAISYKLYLLDSIAGNYENALRNFKQYKFSSDSLNNQNKNEIIALYQVKFALDEQEAENNRLNSEKKADEKVIFYQRLILVVAFVSLAIIVFAFLRLKKLIHALQSLNHKFALQNTQLEELNGIKNKIFSVIAHDLRSPFTQFAGMLKLVEDGALQIDEIVGLIPFLNKSVHQTMEMMDNLLIWSKSQMNGFKVNSTEIDLADLVQDTLDKLQIQINEKKLIVSVDKSIDTVAWADKEMIRIALRNLLSNAIKFTPEQGTIDIESYKNNQLIVVAIRDSGVGMTEDQRNKIFSFNIKSTNGTANEAGTGLGLKICRDMLELNNGKIWVNSILGKGSTFYISLPEKV